MIINDQHHLLEVTYKLLKALHFREIQILEGQGADGGRDIQAISVGTDDSDTQYSYVWFVELKYRKKGNLDAEGLTDRIRRARENGAHFYLLVTNSFISTANRERLQKVADVERIQLRFWDKRRLDELSPRLDSTHETGLQSGVDFRDRWHETEELRRYICSGAVDVLFILGPGGVGKSALCRYMLWMLHKPVNRNACGSYSTGQIDCRLQHDFGFVLKMLATDLHNQGSKSGFAQSSHQRLGEQERLKRLLLHMQEEPTLLLLDNFEELLDQQASVSNPLINELFHFVLHNDMKRSMLLVTSRSRFAHPDSTGNARFLVHDLKGWDINYVYEKYLPATDHLNTSLQQVADTEQQRKEELEILKGNPLALKIADQLCADYSYRQMVALLPTHTDPAQALISAFSDQLSDPETLALQRFAQFDRPLSKQEIGLYVCEQTVLNSLLTRQLVEPLDSKHSQFQIHQITAQHHSLKNQPDARHRIVMDLVSAMEAQVSSQGHNIDDSYFHFLMRQAIRLLMNVEEYDHAAELMVRIGTRVVSMGDVQYLQSTLDALYDHASKLLVARLQKTQGHIDDLKGDFEKAHLTYSNMLDAGLRLEDVWTRAAALNGLGTIARHNGNAEKAIRHYTESLTLRELSDDEIGQSNSHHNLGAVYLEHGELDNAKEHLKRALSLRKKHRDRFRTSATQIYLAELHCHLGDYERARKAVRSSIRIKTDFDDVIGILWARLLSAKIELVDPAGDPVQREELLHTCLNKAQQLSKTRDEMLAQAFLAVHQILVAHTEPNSHKEPLLREAFINLAIAQTLAGSLNEHQRLAISELSDLLRVTKPSEADTTVSLARKLTLTLKV